MRKVKIVLFLLLLPLFVVAGEVEFSDMEWDFGTVTPGVVISKDFVAANTGKKAVTVSVIPTCDCLLITPSERVIPPGGDGVFRMTFDSHDDLGPVSRYYMITTNSPGQESFSYEVHGLAGTVEGSEDSGALTRGEDSGALTQAEDSGLGKDLVLDYYYSLTCKICQNFITKIIPGLEEEYGITIGLNKKDINGQGVIELMEKLRELGEDVDHVRVPVLVYKGRVFQGNKGVEQNINTLIEKWMDKDEEYFAAKNAALPASETKKSLSFFLVFASGLVDGINPCAFAVIIMLITSLALAGKKRKEVLLMGIFFSLAVFVTYYMVGLGFFSAIHAANQVGIVRIIIRWVLAAACFLLAGLSVFDYRKIKEGKVNEMVLQLPDFFKKKIQASIKDYVRSAALVFSSLALGVLVSLFELGCTGQIYLPMITHMVQYENDWFGYFLLLIYNIGFIIPLVGVFVLTYRGISSKKVITVFQKHMGNIKLLMGLVFFIMGFVTIFLNS